MTLIQDNPQQEPLFTLAPPPLAPKPGRKKYAPWHWAVMIAGVPLLAFLSCVGANTVVNWWLVDAPPAHASAVASHKPKDHKSKPPGPRYDLAGFRSAVTGPEEHAFASALYALRADIKGPDYPAGLNDAPRLAQAASSFLTLLRTTKPPPSSGPEKLAYVQAALGARKAGREALEALQTANLGLLQDAAGEAARA